MKKITILLLLTMLGACSFPSKYERNTSKPTYDPDGLKKSKCACIKIYENGKYI